MIQLLTGLILFLGIHSASIVAPALRDRLVAKNELGWKAFYSLLSVVGIVLMVRGYGELRETPTLLYATPVWLNHLAALLLLPAFVLLFAPYFPGRIKTAAKHPQLVAVKLWAFAHLLVSGTLAGLLLFGSFLAWAVADRISMKRRTPRPLVGAPPSQANEIVLLVLGLLVYAAFVFWLHETLFGISPIP